MKRAAENLQFEDAARLRDEILRLEEERKLDSQLAVGSGQ